MMTIRKYCVISTAMLALTSVMGFAQSPPGTVKESGSKMAAPNDTKPDASKDMADGEIRKVDKDTGKLTIKHGEIKSLDMPPMTMVFQVKEKTMLEKVQTGDKIKFKAVNDNGKMMVTEIQAAK